MQSRLARWTAVVIVACVAAAAGWWAGRETLMSTQPAASQSPERVVVTVEEATVGRSLSLNATVMQPYVTLAENALTGVVTWVSDADQFDEGDSIYAVAGVSVRLVEGSMPFYRDLEYGLSGDDVAQLQQLMSSAGVYTGENYGRFDGALRAAVREWQRDNGDEVTGVVPMGSVVAVPMLPAPVSLGEDVVKGSSLAGGEPAVRGPSGERRFMLVVNSEQQRLIPPDAVVEVHHGDSVWPAVQGDQAVNENGETEIALVAADGGEVCADACASLPPTEHVSLRAEIHLVPEATGPAVPAAAIRTAADGTTSVVLDDGTTVPVNVLAGGDGMAVVDGVEAGAQVVVIDTAAASDVGS